MTPSPCPSRLRRWFRLAGLWLLWLGLTGPLQAEVKLPNGEYIERHEDLAVKVLGGTVSVQRTWRNGRWYLNPAWAALRFIRDPLDGSVAAIDRAGAFYERRGDLYVFDGIVSSRHFLERTAEGWRWRDGAGNWIDYDAAGRPGGYGDRHGVRVRFVLDGEGRRQEVRDHFDRLVLSFEYLDGRLVAVRDPDGRRVRYAYEGDRLTQVTDVAGQVWRYDYDDQGQLIRRTDPLGGEFRIFYTEPAPAGAFALDGDRARPERSSAVQTSGRLERDLKIARVGSLTDESGRVTRYDYQYDRVSRQYRITTQPPGEDAPRIERYDREGRLLERWVGQERQRLLTRDGERIETLTDARGLQTKTEYDADRRPLAITYPDGSRESFEYEPQYGQVVRHIDPLGVETRSSYDNQGNLSERIEAVGRPEARRTTWTYDQYGQRLSESRGAATSQWRYDDQGNLVTRTDPLGYSQHFTHDRQGRTLSRQDPLGQLWRAEYDALGRLIQTSDPLGQRTWHRYDALGRRIESTDPTGAISRFDYDPGGRLLAQTDALGQISRSSYDAAGRLSTQTDPAGNVTRLSYDPQGRLLTRTDPAGNLTRSHYGTQDDGLSGLLAAIEYPTYREDYRYDARDRRVQAIQQLEATTPRTSRTGYDPLGRVVSRTDPAGNTSLSEYDALGRLIRTSDPLGGITRFEYDAEDRLIALTDAEGRTHRFEYDLAGRQIRETRPLGGSTQYRYDPLGRLIERTEAEGNVRRYSYDQADNLIEASHTPAGPSQPSRTIQYQYDANHRLTGYSQSGDQPASASYTRDPLGRTTEETLSYGEGATAITRTLRHSFTPDGRRASLVYPDGTQIHYRFDQGRLQRADLPGDEAIRWTHYHWQQPTRIELPGAVRTLDYDPLQRPIRLQVQAIGPGTAETPTGPIHLDWRLAYDPAGNLIQRDTRDGPYSYAYDPLDRLIEVVPPASLPELPLEGYQYDGVGNRTQSLHQPGAWGYDPDHRLTQYGEGPTLTALTHSPNGQRSEVITPNHRTRYHYDATDRLTSIERDGQEPARYQYDPFGRRISKTVAGITTWYLYTDEGLIAELDETGKTTRAYGWELDSAYGTKPLWQAEIQGSSWQFHFLHPDQLGTPQLATDAQGNISWQAQSEAFGRTFPAPTNSITMNLRFPGQYFDQELGLHYNYFRDYDPETGRYVEADPIGLKGGVNVYNYAMDNPMRWIDPSGTIIYVCIRTTHAGIFNHAYFWDSMSRTCCARHKWHDPLLSCKEKGPSDDFCKPVIGSYGLEDYIIDCCKRTANNGPFLPPIWDCHTSVDDCLKEAGLLNPMPDDVRTKACRSCWLKPRLIKDCDMCHKYEDEG